MSRFLKAALLAVCGWALFFFGGWHLVWGQSVSWLRQFLDVTGIQKQSLVWEDGQVLVRVNEKFYGFSSDVRFFDSPFIQWMMLAFALGFFFCAVETLIFGSGNE